MRGVSVHHSSNELGSGPRVSMCAPRVDGVDMDLDNSTRIEVRIEVRVGFGVRVNGLMRALRTPMAGWTLRTWTWTGPVPGARPASALNCAICWFCVCAASHAKFFSACHQQHCNSDCSYYSSRVSWVNTLDVRYAAVEVVCQAEIHW